MATGGSDYHGVIKPDLRVGTGQGDLKVPDRVLDQLEAAGRPPDGPLTTGTHRLTSGLRPSAAG